MCDVGASGGAGEEVGMVSSMEVEADCMLHMRELTYEIQVVIDDRVGDGGLAGGVNSSAQVM